MKPLSLSLEKVWADIRANYDTAFLEDLLTLSNCETYIFGGTVRDMLNNRPWKDVDCRVVSTLPKDERNALVKEVLLRHGTLVFEVDFSDGECKVYRVRMPGTRKIVVDFQVTESVEATPGDFRISSLYFNLKTGELVEQMPGCFDDFEKHLIYPGWPIDNLAGEPHLLLRSLKLACQTGFTHHPDFVPVMREQKYLIKNHVQQVLGYIKENGKNSFVEAMLGNFFNALKSDPKRYMVLLQEFGFYEELCSALADACGGEKVNWTHPDPTGEQFSEDQSFEQRISIFISMLARSISSKPEEMFNSISSAFALDTERSDGSEFVVHSKEIKFV